MKATEYAEAFYRATREKSDREVDRMVTALVRIVQSRGHVRLLKHILFEFEKITRRRTSATELRVRIKEFGALETYATQLTADLRRLGAEGVVQKIHLDPTCIGGYEIQAFGQRIDRTHKRALITMFETISST